MEETTPCVAESSATVEQEPITGEQPLDGAVAQQPPTPEQQLLTRLYTRYGVGEGDLSRLTQAMERAEKAQDKEHRAFLAQQTASVYGIYRQLLAQQERLRQIVPDFTWESALQDVRFGALLRHPFLSVEQAYMTLYGEDLLTKRAEQWEQKGREAAYRHLTQTVLRPPENGISGQSGACVKRDVSKLTKEERRGFLRRARAGERVSF